ncbi:MAG: glycoside hydrolase family 3 N-terminal domain-containing protein [Bacteroidota bacterium]
MEKKIADILSTMTLEEKVGQMTEVTIDVVSQGTDGRREPHELDPAKLENAIVGHHVGSLLNVGYQGYTLDHWTQVITAIQDMATKKTRLHIPIIYGIDAIHGVTYSLGATLFPKPINMAATFNRDLVRREGEITAYEMRASGIPWNYYPVLDVGRQPLWARLDEGFGEDVYLTAEMGRAYIEAHQGSDLSARTKGATCLKHYVGYSYPMSGKDRTAAWISERMLREYFLPPFEEAVKAGCPTVMVNSGEVDGIPGHANYHLLTEVLKGEMAFKGFVVSDWEDIKRLHTRDKVAATPKDAVRMAVMAGVDMSMVPMDYSFYDLLLECVKDGSVPEERINDAVGRILRVKFQLGLFDRPYPDPSLKAGFGTAEHTAANLVAAEESIVLAKNAGILPLSKNAKVLVTGPTADLLSSMNGGWTITWQGDDERLYPKSKLTPLKAIEAKIGTRNVTFVPGSSFDSPINIPAAIEAAKGVDAIVVCLGEKSYCEIQGNIDDLSLDMAQRDLASAMIRTGKPVVLVLIEGRPRTINGIVDEAKGILLAFRPGMEGGRALANILFGDAVPSAKLPVTYPRHPNALMCYDYKSLEAANENKFDPQWPFGYGLSYSTFAYSNLVLDRSLIKSGGSLKVSVSVKNTGRVAGSEAVLMYINDNYGSISRPVKQLKGFQKITLKPGEQETVQFDITSADLSFIGLQNKRIVEPGTFTVMVDTLSAGFTLE